MKDLHELNVALDSEIRGTLAAYSTIHDRYVRIHEGMRGVSSVMVYMRRNQTCDILKVVVSNDIIPTSYQTPVVTISGDDNDLVQLLMGKQETLDLIEYIEERRETIHEEQMMSALKGTLPEPNKGVLR